jgi:hypothetical protein
MYKIRKSLLNMFPLLMTKSTSIGLPSSLSKALLSLQHTFTRMMNEHFQNL